jgi:hypothetical protein
MSLPSTSRNFLLALVLSLVLTFLIAIIYALHPVIYAIVSGLTSSSAGAGSSGIGAVAGGLGESFLWAALPAEPVFFLIIFALLQRRRVLS